MPRYLIKHFFLSVSGRIFLKRILNSWPSQGGRYKPILWGLEQNKKVRKVELALYLTQLGHIFSCPWHSWISGNRLRLDATPIGSLGLRPLNHTTGFCGSAACRWPIVRLLSLHNIMSQCLITNLFTHIFLVSFSGEPWLMYISNLAFPKLSYSSLPHASHFTAIVSFQWIKLKPQSHPWFPAYSDNFTL